MHKAKYLMFTSVRFVTKLFAAIYILYTIEPAYVVCCLSERQQVAHGVIVLVGPSHTSKLKISFDKP